MMNRRLIQAIIIPFLLVSMIAGVQFVNVAKANPYIHGTVPPKQSTLPPQVLISSPKNKTVYNTDSVSLSFDANPPTDNKTTIWDPFASDVYYEADWLNSSVTVPQSIQDHYHSVWWSSSLNLTGIPQGNHSITVYARYGGRYSPEGIFIGYFGIIGSSSVKFSIEIPSPSPSPTPSPFPTIEPTSAPKQQTDFLGTNLPLEYGYAIVAVLAIIVIAGLSLVYLKKLRK